MLLIILVTKWSKGDTAMTYDRDSFLAGLAVGMATKGSTLWEKKEKKPIEYLTFSSTDNFTLSTLYNKEYWDGIIEYSYDGENWETWEGEPISNNIIYMRGS